MARKNQHVVPTSSGWAVKGEGNRRATRLTETRGKAVQIAKKIASNQKSDVVIHGKDGRIQDISSFSRGQRTTGTVTRPDTFIQEFTKHPVVDRVMKRLSR